MSEFLARVDELPERPPARHHLPQRQPQRARSPTTSPPTGDHGEVANVAGGIIAWAAEGLPYEGEPPR